MSYLDKEIERIIKYAEGLGLRVLFVRHEPGDPGATYDNISKEIQVYEYPNQTKTNIIMCLLHELGHHMDWVYNRKRGKDSTRLTKALSLDWKRKDEDPPIAKYLRKEIYQMECRGIDYMDVIAKELGVKIPLWKVKAEQEFDKWIYKFYYLNGVNPTSKEKKTKKRELLQKWRSREK